MIDIEATGIDPDREEDWDGSEWVAGRSKEWFLRCDREPQSEFAREHMVELFRKCNAAPLLTIERLRWELLEFFRACGTKDCSDTFMMGWNCSNFDLPFLIAKGVLMAGRYETVDGKDQMVGDFHYRIYEMGGAVSLAQNARGEKDRAKLLEQARSLDCRPYLPKTGKKHDALYDCYAQLQLLNALIVLAKRGY